MQVKVQIDLATDGLLLDASKNDNKIFGLLRIYEAIGDDKYLDMIARRLWNNSGYAALMLKFCPDDIFDFVQCESWRFEFVTSEENAMMFKTASPNPRVISIVRPKKTQPEELSLKED